MGTLSQDRRPYRSRHKKRGHWCGSVFVFLMTFHAFPSMATSEPEIEHQEVETGQPNQKITIEARITDPQGIFDPAMLYRRQGSDTYTRQPMIEVADNLFQATIPAGEVVGVLEYYLEAYDQEGNGPARFGDEDFPVEIKVLESAAVTHAGQEEQRGSEAGNANKTSENGEQSSATNPEKLETESESSSLALYAGIGGGAGALLIGAAIVVASGVIAAIYFWPSTGDPQTGDVSLRVEGPVPVNGLVPGGLQ